MKANHKALYKPTGTRAVFVSAVQVHKTTHCRSYREHHWTQHILRPAHCRFYREQKWTQHFLRPALLIRVSLEKIGPITPIWHTSLELYTLGFLRTHTTHRRFHGEQLDPVYSNSIPSYLEEMHTCTYNIFINNIPIPISPHTVTLERWKVDYFL